MFRDLSGPIFKALLLGFFCCLGASAKQEEEKATKVDFFSLRLVHPENAQLIQKIELGAAKIPKGYTVIQQDEKDLETGKVIRTTTLLVKDEKIITAQNIEHASPGDGVGVVAILLTKEGGKKLTKATEKMQLNRDRLAVVYKGKCLVAPTVQAVLARRITTTGLDSRAEVLSMVEALNSKRKK